MNVTILGLVIIPLALVWALKPIRLMQLALVSGVFEAAAALIFGGFGLQPAMVPGLLFVIYMTVQYALGMRYPGEGSALAALLPLWALLAYAVMSARLLPDALVGTILVAPQKLDPLGAVFVPLRFTFGNVTQSLYLAINILSAAAVAVFLTRRAIPYDRIIKAYLTGGYVVIGIAFWQFASRTAHLPFPDAILYSNPGWSIVDQALGGVPRIQGPFTEPAGLAFYLSGLSFCCMWLCARGYRVMRPNLLLALAITAMLLSTSTTGLVILAVGLPGVLLAGSRGGSPGTIGRMGRTVALLALGGALVIVPLLILKPELLNSVQTVIDSSLNKTDSDSYIERTEIDHMAYLAFSQSYWLGVGWGSFRAMSLLPGVLANAGAFGAAMIVLQALRIRQLSRSVGRAHHPGRILVDGFSAALCGQIAAAILSAPIITSLAFFLQLGCVVGVLVRISVEQRERFGTTPRPMPRARPLLSPPPPRTAGRMAVASRP